MQLITQLAGIVGKANVLQGKDAAHYGEDWIGKYRSSPLAVVRPASTSEVSAILQLCTKTRTPVVPVSGNTGLTGGTYAQDALMLSLERMNSILEIRPNARIAIVEAGVILSEIHTAAVRHDLIFPLTFGARGSAMIGGALSTNAGGSNVVKYGSTRGLCLGLEVVLPDGEVMNLMSEVHKDNSGYDLKNLFIGAEGTLGIITAAVLKLAPKPRAYATAMVAARNLSDALTLLNRLQDATGGLVEAYEYMPALFMEKLYQRFPETRPPFDRPYEVNILVEVATTVPRDAHPLEDGSVPLVTALQDILAQMVEDGLVLDAVVAQNEAQRAEMWERRERSAEVVLHRKPVVDNDVAVPLDMVEVFLDRMAAALPEIDSGEALVISHLGDGNIHYAVWPESDDPSVHARIIECVETVIAEIGGSFSAEHGIGLSKRATMARRKDRAALRVMHGIKASLDPLNIMNPGKVLPE